MSDLKKGIPFWKYGLSFNMLWRVPRWWLFHRHEIDYIPWDFGWTVKKEVRK